MVRPIHLLTLLSVLLLGSCTHKDLDFSGVTDLTVELDWKACPSANPASMMLAVFTGSSQPIQKHMPDIHGGRIMLPEGNYQMVTYNGETETLYTRGYSWIDFEVCAYPTDFEKASRIFVGTRNIPRGVNTEDQTIVVEPEELWTAAKDDIKVTGSAGSRITMNVEEATFVLHFTIKNVQNIEFISDILATISGMSGSWLPAQHQCSEPLCIIPFKLTKTGNSMSGSVRTFGYRHEGDDAPDHLLVIYTEMSDGSKLYYTFNVTEAMNNAEVDSNGEINVELEELPLPRPINNGTGLHPDVMDWEEIIIPVDM